MKNCTVVRLSTLRLALAYALVSLIALSILVSCGRLVTEYSKIHSGAAPARSANFDEELGEAESGTETETVTQVTGKLDVPVESNIDDEFDVYRQCTVDECLQLQSCAMWQSLQFYVYEYGELLGDEQPETENSFAILYKSLSATQGASSNSASVCLYFVVVTDSVATQLHGLLGSELQLNAAVLHRFQQRLGAQLRFFNRGNHVFLLAPTQRRVPPLLLEALASLPVVIASASGARRAIDVTTSSFIPVLHTPFVNSSADDVWRYLPTLLPVRRRYLASFQGVLVSNVSNPLVEALPRLIQHNDSVAVEFNCTVDEQLSALGEQGDWLPCYDAQRRSDLLRNSTFCLVPGYWRPRTSTSSELVQARVLECLVNGAVPLLLGTALELPFASQLSWQRASLRLPITRAAQAHEVLAALEEHEIAELRRAGRLFAEQRLATVSVQLKTLLNELRERLAIVPAAVQDVHAPSVFDFANETDPGWIAAGVFSPTRAVLPAMENASVGEPLGPFALPAHDSPHFQANRTQAVWMNALFGGTLFGADLLLPSSPFTPTLPNDAQFRGSDSDGFQPVKNGQGGVSADFTAALGGNRRAEQFTVLIVSYKREQELMLAVQRLNNLPHLHSVIVVWNGPARPAVSLVWPNISKPVHVVKPARNSLNNRFLPLDLIRTEAVLTLDDDVALRQDEIVFAFRAWRDTPDRIVGFPARYHAWHKQSQSFKYSYWPNCEYSMVLSGAAFMHKFYFYVYTYVQPSAVRQLVDELMNCEDIAINMLVSHITRKPPVKVTNRWNFPCSKCSPGDAVSSRAGHYDRRSDCLNRLMQIYGYNPLLMTQSRLDSALYMMNEHDVPTNRRCFRNV